MQIPTLLGTQPAGRSELLGPVLPGSTGRTSFEQTLSQLQTASLCLTTAEGDQVSFSGLSLSCLQSEGTSWFSPGASSTSSSLSSVSAESREFSVQGDLNQEELADITRLINSLGSVAASFFAGDHQAAMDGAMNLGDMGSVSSLSASFSRHSQSRTTVSSQSLMPSLASFDSLKLKELYEQSGAGPSTALDYQKLLEGRWQQVLKALETSREEGLTGLMARRPTPLSAVDHPDHAPDPVAVASDSVAPASGGKSDLDQAAKRMLAGVDALLSRHPKLTPFARGIGNLAMEQAAAQADQSQVATAERLGQLRQAFADRLQFWAFADEQPAGFSAA